MMKSILFSSHFHQEVILIFSVTPSAYQTPYSTLITRSYKHSTIPELLLNTKCQDVLVQYTQRYNGQRSDTLCSTPTRNARELMPNISKLYFHVFQSFMLNTKHFINHVLRGPLPTQETYIYIYIINNWLTPNIQNNHHVHMQWGLRLNIK